MGWQEGLLVLGIVLPIALIGGLAYVILVIVRARRR